MTKFRYILNRVHRDVFLPDLVGNGSGLASYRGLINFLRLIVNLSISVNGVAHTAYSTLFTILRLGWANFIFPNNFGLDQCSLHVILFTNSLNVYLLVPDFLLFNNSSCLLGNESTFSLGSQPSYFIDVGWIFVQNLLRGTRFPIWFFFFVVAALSCVLRRVRLRRVFRLQVTRSVEWARQPGCFLKF